MAGRRSRDAGPAGAFEDVLAEVERGKEALVRAVPSPRGRPGPLAEALLVFEESLARARGRMRAWRTPDVEVTWVRCDEALAEAARGAERLRMEAPALDYEALVTVLGDLMAPLDAFEDADRTLRR